VTKQQNTDKPDIQEPDDAARKPQRPKPDREVILVSEIDDELLAQIMAAKWGVIGD
jgi:hypothetical protein